MVPKFAFMPEAIDAAIASAVATCSGSFISFAHAAALPNTPSVAVGCQPCV